MWISFYKNTCLVGGLHRCHDDGELDEREPRPSYFLPALSALCKPHTCEIMSTQHRITGCVGQGTSAGMEQNSAISFFETLQAHKPKTMSCHTIFFDRKQWPSQVSSRPESQRRCSGINPNSPSLWGPIKVAPIKSLPSCSCLMVFMVPSREPACASARAAVCWAPAWISHCTGGKRNSTY